MDGGDRRDGMWEVMERMLRQNRTKLSDTRMGNLDRPLSSYPKQTSIPSFTASEVGKVGYGIMKHYEWASKQRFCICHDVSSGARCSFT